MQITENWGASRENPRVSRPYIGARPQARKLTSGANLAIAALRPLSRGAGGEKTLPFVMELPFWGTT
jgi:hypothetical protein